MEVPKCLPGTTIPGWLIKPLTGQRIEKASLNQMRHGYWEVGVYTTGLGEQLCHAGYVNAEKHLGCVVLCLDHGPWKPNQHEHIAVSVTTGNGQRSYLSKAHAWFYEMEIAEEMEKLAREKAHRPKPTYYDSIVNRYGRPWSTHNRKLNEHREAHANCCYTETDGAIHIWIETSNGRMTEVKR